MTSHQVKEDEMFIKHYSNLCNTIVDIDGLLPYFVQENVVSTSDLDEINAATPPTKKSRVQKLMAYISGPLKGGDSQGFYVMLSIMEEYGNKATQQLAKEIRKSIDEKADQHKCLVGVDGTQVDNLNSASKSENHNHIGGILNYIKKQYCSAMFKGVLVMLLLSILFVVIFVIMEIKLLKHQISMQNDVVTNKYSACDCNSDNLKDVIISERGSKGTKFNFVSQELINSVYKTTNTWYLQLLIKSSINHFQVAPAFISVQTNLTEVVLSKPFFTFEGGHLMRARVHLNGHGDDPHVSIFLHLMKGPHDDILEQSGHLPLRGTFTIELLNPLFDYDHHNKFYLISNDTCSDCTKRVMHEGRMAKGYGSYFISQENLHDYYRNNTLYFRISYSTCYSCVCFVYFSLPLLVVFTVIYMLDGLCIFALLVIFDFCRNLMETSKLVFGLNSIDRNSIRQLSIAISTNKVIIVGIIVVGDILTVIIWEFTGLLSYHNSNIIRNYFSRILFLSLFYQTVSIFSRKNRQSFVVNPMPVMLILGIFDKTTVVIAIISIIIMIFNLCFVIMSD